MLQPHQRAFLDLALARGVLRFGEFTLKSGRISPYFFNLGRIDSGAALAQVGSAFNFRSLVEFSNNLLRGHPVYYIGMTLLILFFSYFWVSVMFKPIQIADDLKKYGGYIPGVRPGEPTASFLDFIMTRLTLAGAIFLTIIAIIPDVLLFELEVPPRIAYFFGGTGMLITVGVILDTMRQIETFLLQRHYDGFLKKGRSIFFLQSHAYDGAGETLAHATSTWKLLQK